MPLEIDVDRRGGVLAIGTQPLPPFNEEDIQIYTQLSRQVSLGTQNLDLLTETRRRLREMDLLLEFTRKLGMLDPRGILAALIRNRAGSAFNRGCRLGSRSGKNLKGWSRRLRAVTAIMKLCWRSTTGPEMEKVWMPLPLRVFASGLPLRSDVAFAQDYSLPSEELLLYRKATGGRLPVSTLIVPVGRANRVIGVLVVDHFNLSNAFNEEDEALALSLAQQSALALENARLFVSSEQRTAQLQALNQVSGALTSSLQRGELISSLLEQLRLVLPYQTATLWLRRENTLSVASAVGFDDNESRQGISVAVQDSALFQEMVQTGQPLSVPDVRQDVRFPSFLEPEHLSWLGVPLTAKGELIGVIALEAHDSRVLYRRASAVRIHLCQPGRRGVGKCPPVRREQSACGRVRSAHAAPGIVEPPIQRIGLITG